MGKYLYAQSFDSAVSFNATLVEESGRLTGETVEPNSFRTEPLEELLAGIDGEREGDDVTFTKIYTDFDGPVLRYVGEVNAKRNRITGRWHFPEMPWVHGTFVMMRAPSIGARQSVGREVEASETNR